MGEDYIEQQAIHFKNSSYFDGKTRVYLEAEDDRYFWDYVISEQTNQAIEYVCYTKNKCGEDVRGCKQILKFLPFFSSDFFACIDSDYRRFGIEPPVSANQFVAQTYAYSWENHVCYAEGLQQRVNEVYGDLAEKFDFVTFLKSYSEVLYPYFAFMLYLYRKGVKDFSVKDFRVMLPGSCSLDEMACNGNLLIEDMEAKFNALCSNHDLWPSFQKKLCENKVDLLDFQPVDTYLYVRGHNLYALIRYIGKTLFAHSGVDFEMEVLRAPLSKSNLPPIVEMVFADLRTILDSTSDRGSHSE